MTTLETPFIRTLAVPVKAHYVDSPVVHYGEFPALNFTLADDDIDNPNWGRITFDKFDALRICRGEWQPYEIRLSEENP